MQNTGLISNWLIRGLYSMRLIMAECVLSLTQTCIDYWYCNTVPYTSYEFRIRSCLQMQMAFLLYIYWNSFWLPHQKPKNWTSHAFLVIFTFWLSCMTPVFIQISVLQTSKCVGCYLIIICWVKGPQTYQTELQHNRNGSSSPCLLIRP